LYFVALLWCEETVLRAFFTASFVVHDSLVAIGKSLKVLKVTTAVHRTLVCDDVMNVASGTAVSHVMCAVVCVCSMYVCVSSSDKRLYKQLALTQWCLEIYY
jgi:hypothetical protein